jgi:hypothetical protein
MTQISRPFQIALAALVLFAAVWFVALRGHSSSGAGSEASAPAASSSSAAASASTPAASANSTSKPSSGGAASSGAHKAQHAASSGSGELKRTIDRARGAVAHSHRAAHGKSPAKTRSSSHAASKPTVSNATASKPAAKAAPTAAVASANTQQGVEAQLKQGKVVAVLFWNPKGTVDRTVRKELQAVSRSEHGGVAVHTALASEIGAFGSFTKAVQVFSTPTMLLIDAHGKTSSLSGLTDAFGIEQAVRELKLAK